MTKKHDFERNSFFMKLFLFLLWVYRDWRYVLKNGRKFNEFGVTIFCGRQGAGKSTSLVWYLESMRKKFPKCKILTNFGYDKEDEPFVDWKQFFEIRNGEDGVIFAIDEIQNEYDSTKWNNFPEALLREITQQRKQRVKIVTTSQAFTRVVKQIREQCFQVVECRCLLGRWVFLRAFDAYDYNAVIDNPDKKMRLRREWRKNYIMDDYLRGLFDSYKKIDRMKNTEYLPRENRLL